MRTKRYSRLWYWPAAIKFLCGRESYTVQTDEPAARAVRPQLDQYFAEEGQYLRWAWVKEFKRRGRTSEWMVTPKDVERHNDAVSSLTIQTRPPEITDLNQDNGTMTGASIQIMKQPTIAKRSNSTVTNGTAVGLVSQAVPEADGSSNDTSPSTMPQDSPVEAPMKIRVCIPKRRRATEEEEEEESVEGLEQRIEVLRGFRIRLWSGFVEAIEDLDEARDRLLALERRKRARLEEA